MSPPRVLERGHLLETHEPSRRRWGTGGTACLGPLAAVAGATGVKLAEAQKINTSLLALGNVITALTHGARATAALESHSDLTTPRSSNRLRL